MFSPEFATLSITVGVIAASLYMIAHQIHGELVISIDDAEDDQDDVIYDC